jgi:hypothetical protein
MEAASYEEAGEIAPPPRPPETSFFGGLKAFLLRGVERIEAMDPVQEATLQVSPPKDRTTVADSETIAAGIRSTFDKFHQMSLLEAMMEKLDEDDTDVDLHDDFDRWRKYVIFKKTLFPMVGWPSLQNPSKKILFHPLEGRATIEIDALVSRSRRGKDEDTLFIDLDNSMWPYGNSSVWFVSIDVVAFEYDYPTSVIIGVNGAKGRMKCTCSPHKYAVGSRSTDIEDDDDDDDEDEDERGRAAAAEATTMMNGSAFEVFVDSQECASRDWKISNSGLYEIDRRRKHPDQWILYRHGFPGVFFSGMTATDLKDLAENTTKKKTLIQRNVTSLFLFKSLLKSDIDKRSRTDLIDALDKNDGMQYALDTVTWRKILEKIPSQLVRSRLSDVSLKVKRFDGEPWRSDASHSPRIKMVLDVYFVFSGAEPSVVFSRET